ncbi:Autotransporter assembly factor TamB [Legionella massiliensis]|uniref:Autotransporter assembly factor TamB n=1 Tax=Legionella massiliensis TaxID=1034943 RepID=A0A078L349_9GAMM|nr:translocation/assembly module TamB domain-containing protein [Legionella massiliensis]CDZ78534.1 Autotransporter assembly factor TamB [Legionella massiliensis]CEE14272.1 Translocation and assembly module TamB [Legionella massiliensis]
MRYILSIFRSLFYKLVLLSILLAGLGLFLLATTPGLFLTSKLAKMFVPGHLDVKKVHGTLIDSMAFEELHYKDDKIELTLKNFNLKWQWKALFDHKLVLDNLQVKELDLKLTAEGKEKKEEKSAFSLPKLPLNIVISNALINQLNFEKAGSQTQVNNLHFQANLDNQLWQLNKLDLNFANMNFALQAQGQPTLPYALTAKLLFTPAKLTDQSVRGLIKIGGDFSLYHWQAEINKPATFIAKGTLRYGNELHSSANWHDFIWPLSKDQSFRSTEGSIQIDGNIPNLSANLSSKISAPLPADIQLKMLTKEQSLDSSGLIKFPLGQVDLNLSYNQLASPKFQGKIVAKSSDSKEGDFPIKELILNSKLSGDSLQDLTLKSDLNALYFANNLRGSLSYQKQQLAAEFNLGKNLLTLQGSPPYNWQLKAQLSEPGLLHPDLAGLQTKIDSKISLSAANQGTASLTIQPGYYKLPDESPLSQLEFRGGQIQAQLNPQKMAITGKLILDQQKSLLLNLSLPQFQIDKGLQDSQKIQAELNLKVDSLSFLERFSPAISKLDGQLNAVLKASGTLKKPILQGQVNLDKAKVLAPTLGLDLNPIQLKMESHDKQWFAEGKITSQEQILRLNGKGMLVPKATGVISIEANNFPLIKTEEYLINLSPKLVLSFSPNSIDMTGTVVVPNAQIKPQTFNDSVSLSGDAVFVSDKPAPAANPLHINTDIRLEMGENVSLNVKGLQGFLDGAIRLRQLPQGPLNASGELTVREGKYQAYGQDLTIEQGELLFTGGLIDNPGINVRAIRQFNTNRSTINNSSQLFNLNQRNSQNITYSENTIVGVQVAGRLKSPRIELFSEPSNLSQADILSLLILGVPTSQADSAGGQLLLKAVTSMNLGSGTKGAQLLDQLKQTLGLDFDFKTNTTFNEQTRQVTESNSVVVGKSLSKRIYLSYNFGLATTDTNVLTLTYLLNKFFSIQVNASTNASGADLLYTHNKKEGRK